ncbi:MAG: Hsp20/alpha crystallin family protein [Candidatus Loosdrechtia sp.]|uniref:Hsp20/alpha crystallin family protein n=1 Tax=Candidatus Loosdrechtia sp. TaxID=3101272 RepID=UPI003A71CCAE|nr:MAG: Hsp20/alpha crystallin family protein [Candidatus Jettenia sp. AMX2]
MIPINYPIAGYKADAKYNIENITKSFFFFNKDIDVSTSTPWQPPTDVYETPDEIVVKTAIAGTKPENIQVVFSEQTLTLSGYRADPSIHENTCFYQVEIRYGYFERSISIPKPIDADNIRATYREGFLQVVLPKTRQQTSKTLLIKINFP